MLVRSIPDTSADFITTIDLCVLDDLVDWEHVICLLLNDAVRTEQVARLREAHSLLLCQSNFLWESFSTSLVVLNDCQTMRLFAILKVLAHINLIPEEISRVIAL